MSQFEVWGIKVTAENAESSELRLEIPATLKFFEGHFPGNPMLPAFATIEISLALGRALKLLPEKITKISSAKFLAAIKPGDQIKVLVKPDATSVDFEWQQKQNDEWKKAGEVSCALV